VTFKASCFLLILVLWQWNFAFSPSEEFMQLIPSETLTVDRKARVNMPFYDLDLRLPNVRMCDFEDVIIPFSAERAMREASPLYSLPRPSSLHDRFAPLTIDIPSAMWLNEQGRFSEGR
jgi:hypothetical protein